MMKLSLLVSLLSAFAVTANPFAPAQSTNSRKAEFMSRLLRRATTVRKLADNVDLSAYSVVYQKCQFVKTYNDNLAYDGSATVLGTQRFVVFRLCPSGKSCSSNYGEYILDLYDYVKAAATYQKTVQTRNCTTCTNNCGDYSVDANADAEEVAGDDGNLDNAGRFRFLSSSSSSSSAAAKCQACLDECNFIENYESEGYYDATTFMDCTKIYEDNDGANALYGGLVCASSGSKIKVGVFTDDGCYTFDSSKDPEDYLKKDGASMKLSYHLMKDTYTTTPISCNDEGDGYEDTYCNTIYGYAAKCEKSTGFSAGDGGDEVQASEDSAVCNYISSLTAGTYSESGEINISGASSTVHGGAKTSGGQKFALTFFIIGTVALTAYAAMLHSKLTKSGGSSSGKVLDSNAGAGAMA